jgi:hypothetical protein
LAGGAFVAGLPLFALWLLGAGFGWLGLLLPVGGVLGAVGLSLERRTRSFSVLPLLLALAGLTATAPIGLVTELVAGASALTALLWVARDRDDPGPIGRSTVGLVLPALAFGLALFTAIGIPAGRQFVGAAVVLLVLALGAVGWALARPGRVPWASSS